MNLNLNDTTGIWILGPNSAPHPSTPGLGTSICVEQGKTPYDIAKQNDHRQVMGVLDPVPWRWVEHLLVHQGYRNSPRNDSGSYWVVAILMLLSCHALELTPMRCHSFCEVFVALLSGRSCKCASAAPNLQWVNGGQVL